MNLSKVFFTAVCCRYSSWRAGWPYLVMLLAFSSLSAQNFTVLATTTTETCPGNASMTLSVQNASADAPVNYKVYKLPNTTNPIFDSSGTTINNLHDGVYYIVATQIVNGSPVEDTIQVTIEDETEPLQYYITPDNAMCGPDGTIVVTVTSGSAVSYEIIAGPVLRPPQASNIMNNVPAGQYSVRVTDNCGTGVVVSHTVGSDANAITVSPSIFPDTQLPACDLITVAHDLLPVNPDPAVPLQTPFTATMTVYPPDGTGPVVFTQTITGLAPGPDVSIVIPFYHDTPYYYDLEIIDACGTVYDIPNNLVDQRFRAIAMYGDAGCPGKYLQISVTKYVGPYTITFFNDLPAGFDPQINPQHPGPFIDPVTAYGSESEDIAVPYGYYSFTVTDACGRTDTVTNFHIEESEVEATVSTFNTNCLTSMGGVEVIVAGFATVEAYITVAPPEYPNPTQDDVSEYINAEFNLEMLDMLPPGDYEVRVIDECGREFIKTFDIEESPIVGISSNVRVDCATGMGTAKIASSLTGGVTKVVMTQAPTAYTDTQTLPYDVSFNINPDGVWYMNNLPPGYYKWLVDDACQTNYEVAKTLSGYATSLNEMELVRHCGSFDIIIYHTSTSNQFQSYWLQKEISPGQWGNPDDNTPYPEGTQPDDTNSYELENETWAYGLPFTGKFRILKTFQSFGTGNQADTVADVPKCIEVLHEGFDFYDDLQLISITSLTCDGDVADIQVTAQGAEPINYMIVSKNGEPFVIDNGNNNVFTGLESAEYILYFEDPCGNFINQPFNIADLPSLVTATTPDNLESCDDGNDGTETFDLSLQNPTILGAQDPAICTVTYHTSLADAETGANPLPAIYTTGTGTIYARVLNTANTACSAMTSFDIILKPVPELNMESSYSMCEGENVYIYAQPGYATYLWNGVEGDDFIEVSEAGSYTVTVTDIEGCETTETVTVTTSDAPTIASIDIDDWNETSNTITVIVEESPSQAYFEYSIDGINYQTSNVFTGLTPGPYNVYVRDTYDCGMDEGEVYLLTYPKFFTPNGDGINDLWRIQFSNMEPDMLIYIYDRYGKIVSSFDAVNEGWDGTLNGNRLPATDYWFVVKRQNGNEYRGHFSMMR